MLQFVHFAIFVMWKKWANRYVTYQDTMIMYYTSGYIFEEYNEMQYGHTYYIII